MTGWTGQWDRTKQLHVCMQCMTCGVLDIQCVLGRLRDGHGTAQAGYDKWRFTLVDWYAGEGDSAFSLDGGGHLEQRGVAACCGSARALAAPWQRTRGMPMPYVVVYARSWTCGAGILLRGVSRWWRRGRRWWRAAWRRGRTTAGMPSIAGIAARRDGGGGGVVRINNSAHCVAPLKVKANAAPSLPAKYLRASVCCSFFFGISLPFHPASAPRVVARRVYGFAYAWNSRAGSAVPVTYSFCAPT